MNIYKFKATVIELLYDYRSKLMDAENDGLKKHCEHYKECINKLNKIIEIL